MLFRPCSLFLCVFVATVLFAAHPAQQSPRQAQLSWWDRAGAGQFGHYWIKTDLTAEEIRPLAQRLNFMYEQYAQRMAHLPVREEEKLDVFVFKSQKDYE